MPAPVVFRSWPCPSCEAEEGFRTKVRLGDYVEVVLDLCSECGHKLTEAEAEEILERAWESAPSDYAGEYADHLTDRIRDRRL